MRCIIPGQCVKLFGRSIQCLSKVGDELFFEALQNGLALRTVNASRSAYACFMFSKAFFYEYDQGCDDIDASNPAEMLKCKLAMKSCLSIFKSLATIEKTVEQCKIEFLPDKCRLVFVLYCRHGITKTHNLTYQECESLQAVFSKELCPNLIMAQSKVLQDTVSNFPNSCDEITVAVRPDSVKVTNYVGDEPDPGKVVHTEMTLVPEEFDNFQIGIDTQVTFCLKELRAILSFSEFVNQPLSLHFEHAGKPIVFALEGDNVYEGNFVLATLCENDSDTQRTETSMSASNQIRTGKEKLPSQQRNKAKSFDKATAGPPSHPKNGNKNKTSHISPEQMVPGEPIVSQKSKRSRVDNSTSNGPDAEDFFTDSFPYKDMLDGVDHQNNTSVPSQRTSLNTSILRNSTQPVTAMETSIDLTALDDDILLSTPPVKKTKTSLFFSNIDKENDNKSEAVLLAADTDDEEDD